MSLFDPKLNEYVLKVDSDSQRGPDNLMKYVYGQIRDTDRNVLGTINGSNISQLIIGIDDNKKSRLILVKKTHRFSDNVYEVEDQEGQMVGIIEDMGISRSGLLLKNSKIGGTIWLQNQKDSENEIVIKKGEGQVLAHVSFYKIKGPPQSLWNQFTKGPRETRYSYSLKIEDPKTDKISLFGLLLTFLAVKFLKINRWQAMGGQ